MQAEGSYGKKLRAVWMKEKSGACTWADAMCFYARSTCTNSYFLLY